MSKPRVVVATPLYGHPSPGFLISFSKMLLELGAQGLGAGWVFTTIPYIDLARIDLVRQALEHDPTHIFWVDHDVTVPADAVARLLAHDLPVVGGMYHAKDRPFGPVAFKLAPFEMMQDPPPTEALHLVGGLGMGATLVKAHVYRLMSMHYEDERWYEVRAAPAKGEDIHFAQRLEEMAIPVFLDPSVRCGHIRDHEVTVEDWRAAATRFVPMGG
ncbi:MAG: hypothetical protein ABR532_08980 [Candidatus Dormibacteria bacterium]